MAVFVEKAKRVLEKYRPLRTSYSSHSSYSDSYFEKVVTKNYISVIGAAGGYWSNDLNTPYLYSTRDQCVVSPFFGGEQFQTSLYRLTGLALPTWGSKSFRRRGKSFIFKNTHIFISLYGLYIQRFKYLDDGVEVKDIVLSLFPFKSNYLVLKNEAIQSKYPLVELGKEYSGAGELIRLQGRRINTVKYVVNYES